MSNPIEVNPFEGGVASEVQTPYEVEKDPRKAFIAKSIHPPSAIANYDGLPTNDTRSQVLIQWRNPCLMNIPIIYAPVDNVGTDVKTRYVTPDDLGQFDYAILHTNGARVLSIPFIFNKWTGNMQQDFNNVDIQDAFDFDYWQDNANLYRPVYKSTTTYLNATMFNNTGMVTGNQFNPALLFTGQIIQFAYEKPEMFFHFACAHHKGASHPRDDDHMTHLDNFMLFPKYIRDELLSKANLPPNTIPKLDPNTRIQIANFNDSGSDKKSSEEQSNYSFVPTPSQIMNNSIRSYAGKAQDGTFTVQHLNTVAPRWLTASNTNNTNSGLYECYYYFKSPTGSPLFLAFVDNTPVGKTNVEMKTLLDTLWTEDMTWAWTYYQGLSLNSQTNVATQLLIKKYYTGYEVQPCPRSAWSGMIELGPKPDLMSMQALMDAFYELKDCMPSKYNMFGPIAAAVAGGVKTFATPILKTLAGSLIMGASNAAVKKIVGRSPNNSKATNNSIRLMNQMMKGMTFQPGSRVKWDNGVIRATGPGTYFKMVPKSGPRTAAVVTKGKPVRAKLSGPRSHGRAVVSVRPNRLPSYITEKQGINRRRRVTVGGVPV